MQQQRSLDKRAPRVRAASRQTRRTPPAQRARLVAPALSWSDCAGQLIRAEEYEGVGDADRLSCACAWWGRSGCWRIEEGAGEYLRTGCILEQLAHPGDRCAASLAPTSGTQRGPSYSILARLLRDRWPWSATGGVAIGPPRPASTCSSSSSPGLSSPSIPRPLPSASLDPWCISLPDALPHRLLAPESFPSVRLVLNPQAPLSLPLSLAMRCQQDRSRHLTPC